VVGGFRYGEPAGWRRRIGNFHLFYLKKNLD